MHGPRSLDDSAVPDRTGRVRGAGASRAPRNAWSTRKLRELAESIRTYDPGFDEVLLARAHELAVRAHAGQTRASGEPFVHHPLEVGKILAGYRVDQETIVGAILHDTVEDSAITLGESGAVTLGDIESGFGPHVAHLVDGVTKVSHIDFKPGREIDAQNLHKLMLAMAQDLRVLIIKLADRLHNLRTIRALVKERQEEIARETLNIYVPLADRIGMQELKEELEDRAFEVLNPHARKAIMRRFVALRKRTGRMTERITEEIRAVLTDHDIKAEVTGRQKRPYSIWQKLERKQIQFGQLADISAFRVIVQETADCYRALGALHTQWPLVPGRFKDHVSVPKPNGYQSLHTTLVGPDAGRIEIQIRTHDMHERAEAGIAAHWQYKSGTIGTVKDDPFLPLRDWIESVRAVESPDESVEFAVSENIRDSVYCFTPKGRIIHLPQRATALDFAYAVHTEVGNTCVGAKVDGKMAPLFQPLKSGQQVEILRSRYAHPSEQRLDDVVTVRARSAIRRSVREHQFRRHASLGERVVKAAFRRVGREPTARAISSAARKLGYKSVSQLLGALGRSDVTGAQVVRKIYPNEFQERQVASYRPPRPPRKAILGLEGGDPVEMAICCYPLPGDRIVGISEKERGIVVHSIDCEVLEAYEEEDERWLDLRWDGRANRRPEHRAGIELVLANQKRALGRICDLIGRLEANIEDIVMVERRPDYGRARFEISVRDMKHLTTILTAVGAETIIAGARQIRNNPPDKSGAT